MEKEITAYLHLFEQKKKHSSKKETINCIYAGIGLKSPNSQKLNGDMQLI